MLCADISMITSYHQTDSTSTSSSPPPPNGGASVQSSTEYELSTDPRLWSREDVKIWLQKARIQFQLFNSFPERFPTNGKGLLLLTRDMFLERVPVGGALLYEDLQFRLQKSLSDQIRQAQEVELLLRAGLVAH